MSTCYDKTGLTPDEAVGEVVRLRAQIDTLALGNLKAQHAAIRQIRDLRQQRDELLAALEGLLRCVENPPNGIMEKLGTLEGRIPWYEQIRAPRQTARTAIVRANGGA